MTTDTGKGMLKDYINHYIRGHGDEPIKVPMMSIRDYESLLKEIGFEDLELDGDELNGWEVDFSYFFNHPKYGGFVLAGSLMNGGFLFYKD